MKQVVMGLVVVWSAAAGEILRADDVQVTVHLTASHSFSDCTTQSMRFHFFDPVFSFKNGSRLGRWKDFFISENGKVTKVRMELYRNDDDFQFKLNADDEKDFDILSYETRFRSSDLIVSKGFTVRENSSLVDCTDSVALNITSMEIK